MISGIPEDNRLPRYMREMKPMLFGFTVSNIETDEDFQDDYGDTRRTWHVTGRVDPKNYPIEDSSSAQEAWEFACYQFIKSRLEKHLHMPVLDFNARVTGRPQKLEEFSREESEEDSETLPGNTQTRRVRMQDLMNYPEWREDATFRQTVAGFLGIPDEAIQKIQRKGPEGWDITYTSDEPEEEGPDFGEDYQWSDDDDYSPDDWDAHWN